MHLWSLGSPRLLLLAKSRILLVSGCAIDLVKMDSNGLLQRDHEAHLLGLVGKDLIQCNELQCNCMKILAWHRVSYADSFFHIGIITFITWEKTRQTQVITIEPSKKPLPDVLTLFDCAKWSKKKRVNPQSSGTQQQQQSSETTTPTPKLQRPNGKDSEFSNILGEVTPDSSTTSDQE